MKVGFMKVGLLIVAVLLSAGCATRMIQNVAVQDDVLIVSDCLLENGDVFQNKCITHRYPLAHRP